MSCPSSRRISGRARGPGLGLVVAGLALAVFLPAFLAVLGAGSREVLAADWSIPEVAIDATVGPDGSMTVIETRTFDFPGDFRWVEEWIPLQGCRDITDVTVREGDRLFTEVPPDNEEERPGTFRVLRDDGNVRIKFWFEKRAGRRTFTLGYMVRDPVVVHNDVAELYWKFIGPRWEVGSDRVTVHLHLPKGAAGDEVRAWAHGPLQGTVSIVDPSLVRFEVANVPSETFVEGRVVFPVRLVLSSGNWDGRDALPGILAEEARWARRANLTRAAMRFDGYLSLFVLLGAFGYGWWLMARYGREHRPAAQPAYYRELPATYSPAELGVLWHFGAPTPADFVATILDLARRGWILIEEVRTERHGFLGLGAGVDRGYRIWRRETPPRDDTLSPHERHLLDFLLDSDIPGQLSASPPAGAAGRPVLFSAIESYAKRHPVAFRSAYKAWEGLVKAQAKSHGFFDEESRRGQVISTASGFAFFILGACLIALRAYVSGAALMVSGSGLFVLTAFLSRRSVEGANQYWLWRGLRNYLRDFSRLDEAAPPALALWDHFLVYAVSLGVAREVIRQLPLVYREAEVAAALGRGWLVAPGDRGLQEGTFAEGVRSGLERGLEGLASFASALTTSLQGSISSASGSGGGFSSGGGGGGGGGGGSAGG